MKKFFFLLMAATAILSACHDSDPVDPGYIPPLVDDDRPEPSTKNTVLVYLAIDNNFSIRTDYLDKVEAMRASWSQNNDGNLFVYCDAGNENPVLVEILQSKKGYNYADTVKEYKISHNSASAGNLAYILDDVKTRRPADKYGLVFLSHATGWLPKGTLLSPHSIGTDDNDKTQTSANEIELADFAEKLPYDLEYVIFDACFMANIEVAYELKDKVKYLVASPAEVLVPGFVYGTMMEKLMREVPDIEGVARDFYNEYDKQPGFMRSATVSVVETAKLDEVAAAARKILQGVDGENALDLATLQNFRPIKDRGGNDLEKLYFDFVQYMELLPDPQGAFGDFEDALDAAIVYKANTPNYYSNANAGHNVISRYSGLTVYIPQAHLPFMNGVYSDLKWAKAVGTYIP